jgi:hypothetical protein
MLNAMLKPKPADRKKPSLLALRRSVASSTAVETGQNVQQLEQKLQNQNTLRFQHIKLAA